MHCTPHTPAVRFVQASLLCLVCPFTASAVADNGLWTSLEFDDAVQQAKADEKLLMAYATAAWCGPCKQMEKTTWPDASVKDWFDEHGIALKFDVDKNRELAKRHRIRAMPTMIAYLDGEEVDRIIGARSAEHLLHWLNEVKGSDAADDQTDDTPAPPPVGDDDRDIDVHKEMQRAQELVRDGRFDDATELYLWLWKNMLEHEPAMFGVRSSFLITYMTDLAEQHEPARESFKSLRGEYREKIDNNTADQEDVADWVVLAGVVDDEQSVLDWFDEIRSEDSKQLELLRKQSFAITKILIDHDRWADIVVLHPEPVRMLRTHLSSLNRIDSVEGVDEAMQKSMKADALRSIRSTASIQYAALLAADREDTANRIAQLLLDADDSANARLSLVATAIDAGQPREVHRNWLDDAQAQGADVSELRGKLSQSLEAARP